MKKNNIPATAGTPKAGHRIARLTLTTKLHRAKGARLIPKTYASGRLQLGKWSIELDDPFALGEIARHMLASRVELFNAQRERLARDICQVDVADLSIAQFAPSQARFLERVVIGFRHQPLIFHVLPPNRPHKPAQSAGSRPGTKPY